MAGPYNVHCSIPHKLVEEAVHRHHVPAMINTLILDFCRSRRRMGFISGPMTSDWHRLEKGIITGWTVSVVRWFRCNDREMEHIKSKV